MTSEHKKLDIKRYQGGVINTLSSEEALYDVEPYVFISSFSWKEIEDNFKDFDLVKDALKELTNYS